MGLAFVSAQWLQQAKTRLKNPPPAAHYAIILGLTTLVLIGCCAYVLWQLKLLWTYYLSWYRFYHGPQNRMIVLQAFTAPVPPAKKGAKKSKQEAYTEQYRQTDIEVRLEFQQYLYRELEGLESRNDVPLHFIQRTPSSHEVAHEEP